MFFSLILYIIFTNYSTGTSVGGGHSIDFISEFYSISDNFFPFINKYINDYFIPYLFIHVLIAFLIIYILVLKSEDYKKVVLLSVSIFLSLETFISFVIFGGKSYMGQFFLMHTGIRYTYLKVLLLIIIIIFGYIFSKVNFKRRFLISDCFLCFLVVYFLFNIIYNYFIIWLICYVDYTDYSKKLRIVSYASDKTALTFSKYDGSVYLPSSFYREYFSEDLFQLKFACYDCQNSIKTMYKIKDKEIQNEKSRLFSFNDFIGLENSTDNYYFLYLKYIYGVNVESLQFDSVGKVKKELKRRGSDVISTGSKKFIWFTDLNSITNKKIDYDLLVNNYPNEAWALVSRGRNYERNKQWEKALNDYTNAIKIDNDNYCYFSNLVDLASFSDYLIVCVPGIDENYHLINADILKALGPNGYLINISRGSVVDEKYLIKALYDHEIKGAALDVFENEPYVSEELRKLNNVILTPHMASATWETRKAMAQLVFDNIEAFIQKKELITPVPECAKIRLFSR